MNTSIIGPIQYSWWSWNVDTTVFSYCRDPSETSDKGHSEEGQTYLPTNYKDNTHSIQNNLGKRTTSLQRTKGWVLRMSIIRRFHCNRAPLNGRYENVRDMSWIAELLSSSTVSALYNYIASLCKREREINKVWLVQMLYHCVAYLVVHRTPGWAKWAQKSNAGIHEYICRIYSGHILGIIILKQICNTCKFIFMSKFLQIAWLWNVRM